MGDTYLYLIPTDPKYVPDPPAQQAALDLFRSLSLTHRPEYSEMKTWDRVEIIHPCECFAAARCPACGAEVDLDGWWYPQLDALYDLEHGFADLNVTLPCCGTTCSLNDLEYDGPAGFARWALRALYPNRDVSDEEVRCLEEAVGKPLRRVWMHT